MNISKSSRRPARAHELRTAFMAADHDQDGRISIVEFEHLLANLEAGKSKQELVIGFHEVDADHDGLIDAQESMVWWRSD
jgi:Ca2+-binding EF-hand superfamily protein